VRKFYVLSLSLTFMMTGCAKDTVTPVTGLTLFEKELLKAAQSVSLSMERLALVEQTLEPPVDIDVSELPIELARRLEYFEWSGPIAVPVQRLASEAGYDFSILGRPTTPPVIVFVEWKDIRVIDALKDVGLKAGKRATIAVDVENRSIEVRYES